MPASRSLGAALESLEDRSLPSTLGTPWADPSHLTLSFATDGTTAPTGPSALFATMSSVGPASAWEAEILRAFQTWAVNANINIGLVADGGQALGTVGAVQGDARFGDVRVAAAPLSASQIAAASSFSWTGTTSAGDVVFNSAMRFARGPVAASYDLYSVALHEAGHVFGLGHAGEDTAMNAGYVLSTGLSVHEIADLRTLYGARSADAFDAKASNGTLATASKFVKDVTTGRYTADADLTARGDVDFYQFKAGATTATIALQAKGLSLLQARVSVYDASGRLLASGAAANAFNNDVSLNLTGLKKNATYFVKVEGTTADVFSVGAYRLTAEAGKDKKPKPVEQPSVTDAHTNDTLRTATDLNALQARATDARFDATYRGAIEDAADTDFYRIRMPATGTAENLYVMAWATDGALDPRVRVFDANGQAVAFRVLANEDGLMSVVAPNATSGIYYVQVSGKATGATGGYVLAADFNGHAPAPVNEVDSGQLSASAPRATETMTVGSELYQFALDAEALSAGAGGVALTVTDSAGRVVLTLDANSDDPTVTGVMYLTAGTYTFTYTYHAVSGRPTAAVRYHLAATALSEGVGTYAPALTGASPTTAPAPSSGAATTTDDTSLMFAVVTFETDAMSVVDDTDMMYAPTDDTMSTTPYTTPTTSMWYGGWYFF